MKYILLLTFILSSSINAATWHRIEPSAIMLKIHPKVIDDQLWEHISKYNIPLLSRDSYNYQYQIDNDSEISINAFCRHPTDANLSKRFVLVKGGGNCYFQAIYNRLQASIKITGINHTK